MLAGTVTVATKVLGSVATNDGTIEADSTTTQVESEAIVAILDNGTFSIAH